MIISKELLTRLGPEVSPFERRNNGNKNSKPKRVAKGEKIRKLFLNQIVNIKSVMDASSLEHKSYEEILKQFPVESMYLWIIDREGLKVLKDSIKNPYAIYRERGNVCHTNITGGKKALQGGEVWFSKSGNAVVNPFSGRYGAIDENHENAIIEYFTLLGFKVTFIHLNGQITKENNAPNIQIY